MRFWEKNYLYTLALFTLLLFICIFIIAASSFTSAFKSERDAAFREEFLITQSIQKDITDIESRKIVNSLAIPSRIASYAAYYQKKGIFLSVSYDGALVYGNIPFAAEKQSYSSELRYCETLSRDESTYLCIHDTLKNKYTVVYLKDISASYASLKGQTGFLLVTGSVVSVLFALGLYFTLKKVYKPINNLAHELRTPLTAIRGYAEYLQGAVATEKDRYSAAGYIINESKRLNEVCEKLLIMANMREGEIRFEKVNVRELFQNAKMTFKNVECKIKKLYIKGDKTLLQSMINNLVSNALKASPPEAAVQLSSYDNIIEITDSGKGIEPRDLLRISKPNFRRHISFRGGGSGLGLPLCHQIARLHNAKLEFQSAPGKGTTARVTFTSL